MFLAGSSPALPGGSPALPMCSGLVTVLQGDEHQRGRSGCDFVLLPPWASCRGCQYWECSVRGGVPFGEERGETKEAEK